MTKSSARSLILVLAAKRIPFSWSRTPTGEYTVSYNFRYSMPVMQALGTWPPLTSPLYSK